MKSAALTSILAPKKLVSHRSNFLSKIEFPEKSFSHQHFSNGEVTANKSELNKKIAQSIKMQHFHIGDTKAKLPQETSNNANFAHPTEQRRGSTPIGKVQTVVLDHDMKKELRKAHFNFGNDNPSYETSHQQQFNQNVPQRSISELNSLKNA